MSEDIKKPLNQDELKVTEIVTIQTLNILFNELGNYEKKSEATLENVCNLGLTIVQNIVISYIGTIGKKINLSKEQQIDVCRKLSTNMLEAYASNRYKNTVIKRGVEH